MPRIFFLWMNVGRLSRRVFANTGHSDLVQLPLRSMGKFPQLWKWGLDLLWVYLRAAKSVGKIKITISAYEQTSNLFNIQCVFFPTYQTHILCVRVNRDNYLSHTYHILFACTVSAWDQNGELTLCVPFKQKRQVASSRTILVLIATISSLPLQAGFPEWTC